MIKCVALHCALIRDISNCNSKRNPGQTEAYYSEFEYDGQLVVVTSGVPDHDAENNTDTKNPNWRCEFNFLPCSTLTYFKDV